ncbi:acetyl esterase/lipase [Gelidibacter algens]|uniref:Acetyl esterase/lipase n=1 Tax=Gelidibacter algens TaxID=49280 RepID=A0A1A7R2P4_9FLAO|nr:alpha/beta hydrolase [Gelidibacter algens]OBX25749.1 lipase [Gelidibacter algens]RAJ21094.1 acetyl esterase/lipase [Gelidibacter algens]
MKAIKVILLSVLLVLITFSCSKENTDTPNEGLNTSEYYEELNVSYGSDNDQKFDLYLPQNRSTSTKVMILVHGGGWSAGDKADMNSLKDIIRLDLPNLAIVNLNYRLADANNRPYPMQIEDITSVISHLKENQDFYGISDDYGFIGTSAGAHLALLWSYAFDSDKDVKMVCSIVGPTNFTDPAYLNTTDPNLRALMDVYGVNASTEFLEEVSPYHRVTATAPPTIMFYGGKDPLIPTTQGTAMRARLQQLGITHEFTLYENAGHGWVGLELLDTWSKLKAFTQTHL